MCNLALPITVVLIEHSVSKCFVREQSKRLSHCRNFLQFVYMEYVLEAAGFLQLHNVSERMSLSEQELFLHRSVSEISWHVEEEVRDVEVTIPLNVLRLCVMYRVQIRGVWGGIS